MSSLCLSHGNEPLSAMEADVCSCQTERERKQIEVEFCRIKLVGFLKGIVTNAVIHNVIFALLHFYVLQIVCARSQNLLPFALGHPASMMFP